MNWQSFFLTADGRIGRKDFWLGYAILFAAGFVAGMLPLVGPLISLALIWPSVCIFAKRLHDAGRSGWLAAIPFVIWTVGTAVAVVLMFSTIGGAAFLAEETNDPRAVAAMFAGMGTIFLVALVGFIVYVAFLLWVGLTQGDPAPNRYGAPQPSAFDTYLAPTAARTEFPAGGVEGNLFGIIGFVLGVLSLVTAVIPMVGIFAAPSAVLGLIFGLLGRGKPAHRGLTLAGLICSGLALLLAVLWIGLFAAVFATGISEAA